MLIALWADGTRVRIPACSTQDHPENFAELKRRWPFGKFPLLVDDGEPVIETTPIIEHLQAHHPGPNRWIPDGELGLRVRFLDRFFDLYVMDNMQPAVDRRAAARRLRAIAYGAEQGRENLHIAYDWLEANLGDGRGRRASSSRSPIAPRRRRCSMPTGSRRSAPERPQLAAYRARLLAHPIVARAVDEGRPYRAYFPLGAPDRD